jgi:ribose transport system permease protein
MKRATVASRSYAEDPRVAGSPTPGEIGTDVAVASGSISLGQRVRASRSLGAGGALVLFTLIGILETSTFLKGQIWVNITRDASFTAIVACFEALVIISGGIDLSVGASFLAGAMTAGAIDTAHGVVPAILGAAGVGIGIGLVNGILISFCSLSAIIVTLGTLFATTSVVTTLSGGATIGPLPNSFTIIGEATWGPVPVLCFYALAIALCAHVVLEHTAIGTAIRATGGNREAARALGLSPRSVSAATYVLAGLFASLAGMLEAANLGASSPTFGTDLELTVIAAVVIGGTSIYGAIGSIPGAVLGSLLLSVLTSGLVLLHINGNMQDFVVGVVIILAVAFDRLRTQRMFRIRRLAV